MSVASIGRTKHSALASRLRSVLLQLQHPTPKTQQKRRFTSQQRGREEISSQPEVVEPLRISRHDSGRVYRTGRVVSKGKRTWVESSEQLAIPSLGETSQIIVLRDVEAKAGKTDHHVSLEPQTISEQTNRTEVTEPFGQDSEGDDADALATIDQLRPEANFLSDAEFERLLTQLTTSYSADQLTAYLQLVQDPSNAQDSGRVKSSISEWKPHETKASTHEPSSKRLHSKAKLRAASSILASWNVRLQSNEQKIGDLTLFLERSQLDFINRTHKQNGEHVPVWRTLIDSPLLARCISVSTTHNKGLRITGRQGDCLEAAQEILDKIFKLSQRTLNVPSTPSSEMLRIGLDAIMNQTGTVIKLQSPSISISGLDEAACRKASSSVTQLVDFDRSKTKEVVIAPRPRITELYERAKLSPTPIWWTHDQVPCLSTFMIRQTVAHTKKSHKKPKTESKLTHIKAIVLHYIEGFDKEIEEKYGHAQDGEADEYGYSTWRVELGLTLRRDAASRHKSAIFSRTTPGLPDMLKLLSPHQVVPSLAEHSLSEQLLEQDRYITLKMLPLLPNNNKVLEISKLPTLELVFSLARKGTTNPLLFGLRAILSTQQIRIDMPEDFLDIRLSRDIERWIPVEKILEADDRKQSLSAAVRSIQAAESVEECWLGETISLPASLLPKSSHIPKHKSGQRFDYLIASSQQRETMHLIASDDITSSRLKPLKEKWKTGTMLHVTDISSGDQSRRELTLHGRARDKVEWHHLMETCIRLTSVSY